MSQPDPFSTSPVLLGGDNRSGTTLLSIVLDSHLDLVAGPEIDFLEPPNLGPHILGAIDLLAVGDWRVTDTTKNTIDPFWYDGVHFVVQCRRFGLDFDDLRGLVRKIMVEVGNDIVSFIDRCRLVNEIGELRRARSGAQRWGLKLQRKITRIDDFARLWPRAHFVHIVRDGRDVAASHLKTVPDWGYRTVADAARGWLEVVSRPHRIAPPGRYLEVRYEDLVSSPRTALTMILDHLDLPWDEAVLRHAEYEHALFEQPHGHPAAEAAGKPLHQGRIGRHVQDLTPSQIVEFEEIAGSELARLGYLSVSSPSGDA
ncbi:sulfotransferase [Bradyrhizobium sp. Pear77]|uniref:sulfotransferase family protein n=1 Tax=Bradyrhizobium TaxID=374 RepID=UPI001E41A2EA|nr:MULTISPECIES: sulfotransferase [Bradyrhizobium]MCC8955194.1 sulfotransferase [Bradyrhizobium altum]MCC8966729.1 sulfotransferase [Bradyrhizobium oropedii]